MALLVAGCSDSAEYVCVQGEWGLEGADTETSCRCGMRDRLESYETRVDRCDVDFLGGAASCWAWQEDGEPSCECLMYRCKDRGPRCECDSSTASSSVECGGVLCCASPEVGYCECYSAMSQDSCFLSEQVASCDWPDFESTFPAIGGMTSYGWTRVTSCTSPPSEIRDATAALGGTGQAD